MFAKRRRTGVVRLFYVLVSLVFVGGGCVDMKVRKLSLAFFAALFEKKILLKFERNVKVVFCRVVVQKSRVLREEREKFFCERRREKINQSFFFLKEFCRGEDEQKRRPFSRGTEEASTKAMLHT